jgi:dihydrofolate synthase/folylpolyglutamate synthase
VNYAQALTYLYSFANYEASAMSPRTDLRLNRMRRLLELAGNPHHRFRSVLIAGTKGKGSTAAMLASISQAAGQQTALYTTPHLNTHRERMRIDGQLISHEEFARRMVDVRRITERYANELGAPTTYELGTLLAFQYFADHAVDLAVVEVGLGGRLDATNVLDTELAIITSVSYDHMEVLGYTLAEIATEKAGIIKPGKPVVSAPQRPEAMAIIERVAGDRHSELIKVTDALGTGSAQLPLGEAAAAAGQDLWIDGPVRLPLLGVHQRENAAIAVAAARQLGLPSAAIRDGLASVRWPGRLEIARERPPVVLDGAHNVDSMEKLAAALRRHFRWERLRAVAGFSADKDIPGMARILNELADEIVLTRSAHPRAADPLAIAPVFRGARIATNLADVLARQGERELVLITGSLYLVGEARLHLGLVPPEEQDPL